MVTVTIDGRAVRVEAGTTLLDAARAAGVQVPTLCHHPALEPFGGCRLCLVDVARHGWNGQRKLVAACMFPAEDGLIVLTNTERVQITRRAVVDLLLARCPETPLVQRLARDCGLEQSSYTPNPAPTDCVLCGLCTRACERIGVSAIASANRGTARIVGTPFDQAPPDCIGCLACAEVCPTGHIRADVTATTRTIWGRTFQLVPCPKCGRGHVTADQLALERSRRRPTTVVAPHADGEDSPDDRQLCESCRRLRLADTIDSIQASVE